MKTAQPLQEQIIKKLENYCAYRERCESEVKHKLQLLQVEQNEMDPYLNHLKENNFLNEERFISAFIRGKFNIKSWGKRKIVQELKNKRITDKMILPLVQIDEGLYFLRLQDVLEKKIKTIRETDQFKKKQKLIRYAMQKGYEPELIDEALKIIEI